MRIWARTLILWPLAACAAAAEDVVMIAVAENSDALSYASDELQKDPDVLALIETHSLFKSSLPVVCFCQAGVTPFLLDGFFCQGAVEKLCT